jgi:hypothetical protein
MVALNRQDDCNDEVTFPVCWDCDPLPEEIEIALLDSIECECDVCEEAKRSAEFLKRMGIW